jgi:hypothetical protein
VRCTGCGGGNRQRPCVFRCLLVACSADIWAAVAFIAEELRGPADTFHAAISPAAPLSTASGFRCCCGVQWCGVLCCCCCCQQLTSTVCCCSCRLALLLLPSSAAAASCLCRCAHL